MISRMAGKVIGVGPPLFIQFDTKSIWWSFGGSPGHFVFRSFLRAAGFKRLREMVQRQPLHRRSQHARWRPRRRRLRSECSVGMKRLFYLQFYLHIIRLFALKSRFPTGFFVLFAGNRLLSTQKTLDFLLIRTSVVGEFIETGAHAHCHADVFPILFFQRQFVVKHGGETGQGPVVRPGNVAEKR